MKKGATTDIIWTVILACGSIALLLYSYGPQNASLYTSLGGMFWPRILLWGILLFSACLLGVALLSSRSKKDIQKEDGGKYPKTPIFVFFTCFGYFLLLDVIGFVLATLLFLGILLIVLGIRNKVKIVAFSITTVAIFWLVFVQLLHVPLPRGTGIFRQISIFIFHY